MTNASENVVVSDDVVVDAAVAAVEVAVEAPKAKRPTLKMTVATVKAALAEDRDYLGKCILLLAARQTEDELVSHETRHKNRRGFASSKAVWGTRYAECLIAGGTLEGYEHASAPGKDHVAEAVKICTFHAKQIARAELEG